MIHSVLSRLRKSAQTRTDVHSLAAQQRSRTQELRMAYRTLASIQILGQLFLWTIHWLYWDLEYASWQPVLLVLLPALSLFFLWGASPVRPVTTATHRIRLFLLPCLWLDSGLLFITLTLLCQLQLTTWPIPAIALGLGAFAYFTLILSGRHGVAFGISQLWWALILLIIGTFTFGGQPTWENLWPFLGGGVSQTLRASLLGVGSCWGVAFLFILPKDAASGKLQTSKGKLFLYALLPVAIVLIWIVYHTMRAPWLTTNHLVPKENVSLLLWSSTNLFMFLFAAVLWFVLLPASISGNSTFALHLIQEAIPRAPKKLVVLLYLIPPMILAMLPPTETLRHMQLILPYRFIISALVGAATLILDRRHRA